MAGITLVKDENGETISMGKGQTLFGFTFNDGTFVETGFGREGVLAAQAIANDSNNGTLDKAQTLAKSSALQTLEAKANRTPDQIIADFADLNFLAQNTGVSSNVLNTEKRALGLDLNDPFAANTFLNEKGYSVGSPTDFYGDNAGPTDAAAKILNDKWQQSKLVQEKLDEEGKGEILINNNVANSLHLAAELSKQNISPASTNAIIRSDYGVSNVPSGGSIVDNPETGKKEFKPSTATDTDGRYNMLEWDRFLKEDEKEKEVEVDTGGSGNQAGSGYISQQVQPVPNPTITPAQVYSPDADTFKIAPEAVTPYFNPANTSVTSTTTTPAEQFDAGITRQNTAYSARAPQQAQYYQPQTMQEMTDAGQSTDAFKLNQKLYRNPNTGHQLYIPHRGEEPLSPIPPGYVLVNQGGTFAGAYNPVTAGGNPTVSANQGGMIQGFNDGTAQVTEPTSPGFDPNNIYGNVSFQDPMDPTKTVTQNAPAYFQTLQNKAAQSTVNPAATIAPMGVQYMQEQYMPGTVLESTAGQALPTAPMVAGDQIAQVSNVTQSTGAVNPGAAQANFTQAAPTVKTTMEGLTPAQQQSIARDAEGNPIRDAAGNVLFTSAPTQLIDAQESSTSSVTGLDAATKTDATDVTTPTDRKIQVGEKIVGTGVDQSKVDTAFGTGQVAAASLTGELATLMRDFDGGDTPAWAAGAMRQATAVMNDRGLGASSMAGQAIVQAAMEAALPIAQIEAGNKQQVALFNGEQRAKFLGIEFDQAFQAKVQNAARVSEIANLNFTAKQTIALENSRAANTVNLADLSNKQAVVMAEAAALSQLDMASLNNRQQAAVQNAQNFLQVDMANLTNAQQTAIFKAQTSSQALLSDTAQANAAAQFNATSENQTNQFFSNLATQVSQFNSAQKNAIDQFNAEETNALLEFNSALQNQREMFNSQNYLAVAQANAVWRQNINTANTEAQNLSNAQYAKDVNDLSQKALDDYWQKERDIMSYVFAQSESQADRAVKLLLGEMESDSARDLLEFKEGASKTGMISKLILGDMSLAKGLDTFFD